MSIVNIFNNSKKRNLSENCNSDGVEDPKKLREKCQRSCEGDARDVFAKGVNDSSCLDIVFNLLSKDMLSKVVKIYEVASTAKESQIKAEKQLEDLISSVDYITKMFDEYMEESKKKGEQIKCLRERVSFLEIKNGKTEQQIDRQE